MFTNGLKIVILKTQAENPAAMQNIIQQYAQYLKDHNNERNQRPQRSTGK